jgi:hypothetical protein
MSHSKIKYSPLRPLAYVPGVKVNAGMSKGDSFRIFFPDTLLQYLERKTREKADEINAWQTYHINSSTFSTEKVIDTLQNVFYFFIRYGDISW